MKIYITGNISKAFAQEIEKNLDACGYCAYADECGDDNSSYNDILDNLKGYTDVILVIDLLESCANPAFAFKTGYIIGKYDKKNVSLYFLHTTDKEIERPLGGLKFYCINETKNEHEVAEEICFELLERWQEERISDKIKNDMLIEQKEEIYIRVLKFCISCNQASVFFIQRQFPVGYATACKIFDWMAENKYILKQTGGRPAKVLLTYEEFKNIYGEIDD